MWCNCSNYLRFTCNLYKPGEADLPVYICENCKKYYILVNFKEVEVKINLETGIWELVNIEQELT